MEKRTMALCLAAIWGAAGMMASPLALFANTTDNPMHFGSSSGHERRKICSEITSRIFVKYAKLAYSSGVLIVQYLVPLGIVVAAYARICVRLQHRMRSLKKLQPAAGGGLVPATSYQTSRQAAERTRQRRANRLLVSIAIVFGLSWLPLTIVNIVQDLHVLSIKQQFDREGGASYGGQGGLRLQSGSNSSTRSSSSSSTSSNSKESTLTVAASQSIPLLLVLVSACLNPVFYGWFNENFQAEFHRLLCLNRLARAGPKFRVSGGGAPPPQQQQTVQPTNIESAAAVAIPLIVLLSANDEASSNSRLAEDGRCGDQPTTTVVVQLSTCDMEDQA